MSWTDVLLQGVIATILGTLILALAGRLVKRKLIEKWVGRFSEDGHEYYEDIKVWRLGRRIIGKSRLEFSQEGKKLTARYRIRGVLDHAILTAFFEGLDNKERGAFLIKYSFAQDGYSGKYLLIDHEDGISSVDYSWERSQ